jgi:hypothetical protein
MNCNFCHEIYHKYPDEIINKDCEKTSYQILKKEAIDKILHFNKDDYVCWKCGIKDPHVLSIGHINQDGKADRKKFGRGTPFMKNIINGTKIPNDLKIECMNCNCCLQWYGKYPDEMNDEEFITAGGE